MERFEYTKRNCKCGCGQEIEDKPHHHFGKNKYKRIEYIQGHNSKGENNPMYGKKHLVKSIEKMIEIKLGDKNPRYGQHLSKESKEKLRLKREGENNPMYHKEPWNKGQKLPKELVERMIKTGKKYIKEHPEVAIRLKKQRKIQIFPIKDTKIELKIQNFLRILHVEFMAHYYVSEITHAYQCDILIPFTKTIIECDGCYWHGCPICNKNLNGFQEEQIKEDRARTNELLEKGYNVIRLWEHDIKKMELNDFMNLTR